MVHTVFLATPRGFCAGVSRAVNIVKKTLEEYGAPVYVRHEIVHNKHVVNALKERGAVFISEFDEMTDPTRPVVLSAHGVEQSVIDNGTQLGLHMIDATCPLVDKVHRHIKKLDAAGAHIIVIGKAEHPEIIGTVGQIKNYGQISIINSVDEALKLNLPPNQPIGVVTQTTLSVENAQAIISILRQRYPLLLTADKNDICYATTHRQAAVKELAKQCDAVIIIGSKNSSNSKQLQKTALQNGVAQSWLIDDVSELQTIDMDNISKLGISAGASAPEHLVCEVLTKLKEDYANIKIRDIIVTEEHIAFKS